MTLISGSKKFFEIKIEMSPFLRKIENNQIQILKSNKGNLETFVFSPSFERISNACDILVNKLMRDAYLISSTTSDHGIDISERAFTSISDDFIMNMINLRKRGLSTLMSYLISFYELETDQIFFIKEAEDYLRVRQEFSDMDENSRVFSKNQDDGFIEFTCRQRERITFVDDKIKNNTSKSRNYRSCLRSVGESWSKLCVSNHQFCHVGTNYEKPVAVYESQEDMSKYSSSDERILRSIQFCRECCYRVIEKFERITNCLEEMFCLYSMNQFVETDLNEFFSNCFNTQLEVEKLKLDSPLWYKFGVYPEVHVGFRSLMTVKVMLKTGLGTEANETIAYLLNNEKTINTFLHLLSHSRLHKRSFENNLRHKMEERKEVKEDVDNQETSFIDWFNSEREKFLENEIEDIQDFSDSSTIVGVSSDCGDLRDFCNYFDEIL